MTRIGQRESGVAQKDILQFVDGLVRTDGHLCVLDELALGEAEGIAQGIGFAVGILREGKMDETHIERAVVVGINGTRGTDYAYGGTILTEQGVTPQICANLVVGGYLARRENPQRTCFALVGGHFFLVEEEFVGKAVGAAVAVVIEDECAALHGRFQLLGGFGIGAALRCLRHHIGIRVDAPQQEMAAGRLADLIGHLLGIVHVKVVVAYVGYSPHLVFPTAYTFIVEVFYGAVSKPLGIGLLMAEETAYSQIELLLVVGCSLTIVKKAEIIIRHVAVHGADGIVRVLITFLVVELHGQQVVVGGDVPPVGSDHPVVEGAVAKQKEVAGGCDIIAGAVVKHLQIPTISGHIRSTGGELIVELAGRNDLDAHPLLGAVGLGQAFSLGGQLAGGGYDDDIVNGGIGMEVLIGHWTYHLRGRIGLGDIHQYETGLAVKSLGGIDIVLQSAGQFSHGGLSIAQLPHTGVGIGRSDLQLHSTGSAGSEGMGGAVGAEVLGIYGIEVVQTGGTGGFDHETLFLAQRGCEGAAIAFGGLALAVDVDTGLGDLGAGPLLVDGHGGEVGGVLGTDIETDGAVAADMAGKGQFVTDTTEQIGVVVEVATTSVPYEGIIVNQCIGIDLIDFLTLEGRGREYGPSGRLAGGFGGFGQEIVAVIGECVALETRRGGVAQQALGKEQDGAGTTVKGNFAEVVNQGV